VLGRRGNPESVRADSDPGVVAVFRLVVGALEELTGSVFSEPYRQLGVGGGIPFMEMLGSRYAGADFVITGALGTDSNVHVPDEWLNIEYAKQVTAAVASILDAHASLDSPRF
jgi:hypothetical protein